MEAVVPAYMLPPYLRFECVCCEIVLDEWCISNCSLVRFLVAAGTRGVSTARNATLGRHDLCFPNL